MLFAILAGAMGRAQAGVAPSAGELDWRLERTADDTIAWTGMLPPGPVRRMVPWQARAVWVSVADAETTRLLADSGRLLTEYRPRHRLVLGTLAVAPGPGRIDLAVVSGSTTIAASANSLGRATEDSYDTLLEHATAAAEALNAETRIARVYGVRDPEAIALNRIAELYVARAGNLETGEARDAWGRWWLMWIAPRATVAKDRLYAARRSPEFWRAMDDTPLGLLRTENQRIEAAIWLPDGQRWTPVRLAGIEGAFKPFDLATIKDLGFNTIHPETATNELRIAAQRLNIALAQDVPSSSTLLRIYRATDMARGGPRENAWMVTSGWEFPNGGGTSELTNHPWRLWRWARAAISTRLGEEAGEPQEPEEDPQSILTVAGEDSPPSPEFWDP